MAVDPREEESAVTETAVIPDIDPAEVEQAAGQVIGILTGGMLSHMIDIGARTNLFDALSAGPATCVEIADRAGLTERYVREWLAALVTGGIVQYDPSTSTYALPAALAAVLTDGPMNMTPF